LGGGAVGWFEAERNAAAAITADWPQEELFRGLELIDPGVVPVNHTLSVGRL
jgi:hypothetical protein